MNPRDLGNFIRVLRLQHNYTQRKLAERLDISHKDIQSWEDGQSLPDDLMLMQLAAVFHMTYEELVRGKEAIPADPFDEKFTAVLHQILLYGGITITSLGLSLLYAPRAVFVLHLFVVVVGVLLTRFVLIKRQPQSAKRQYLMITLVLFLIAIVMMIVTPNRFFLRREDYIHVAHIDEQIYDAPLGRETDIVTFHNDEIEFSGIVYSRDFNNFRVVNFTRYNTVPVIEIDTGDEKVVNAVYFEGHLYVGTVIVGEDNHITTFDYAIYEYDIDTWDRTLVYQSDEAFDLYTTTFRMFMVTSYHFGPGQSTNVYSFDFDMIPYKIKTVPYTIWDMHETMDDMQTRVVVSATSNTIVDGYMYNDVLLVDDNDFSTTEVLVEDLRDPMFFSGNHRMVFGYNEDMTYRFDGSAVDKIKELGGFFEFTFINEELYYGDFTFYDNSYTVVQKDLFYDKDFNRFEFGVEMIPDDNMGFYSFDNELMGYGFQMNKEPYLWTIHIVYRFIYGGLSILLFGVFVRLGQNSISEKKKSLEETG